MHKADRATTRKTQHIYNLRITQKMLHAYLKLTEYISICIYMCVYLSVRALEIRQTVTPFHMSISITAHMYGCVQLRMSSQLLVAWMAQQMVLCMNEMPPWQHLTPTCRKERCRYLIVRFVTCTLKFCANVCVCACECVCFMRHFL